IGAPSMPTTPRPDLHAVDGHRPVHCCGVFVPPVPDIGNCDRRDLVPELAELATVRGERIVVREEKDALSVCSRLARKRPKPFRLFRPDDPLLVQTRPTGVPSAVEPADQPMVRL